jgi:hypothetical protein
MLAFLALVARKALASLSSSKKSILLLVPKGKSKILKRTFKSLLARSIISLLLNLLLFFLKV